MTLYESSTRGKGSGTQVSSGSNLLNLTYAPRIFAGLTNSLRFHNGLVVET